MRARERFAVQPAIRFHVSSGRFNSAFWSSHCLYGLQTVLTGSARSDDFDYVAGRESYVDGGMALTRRFGACVRRWMESDAAGISPE